MVFAFVTAVIKEIDVNTKIFAVTSSVAITDPALLESVDAKLAILALPVKLKIFAVMSVAVFEANATPILAHAFVTTAIPVNFVNKKIVAAIPTVAITETAIHKQASAFATLATAEILAKPWTSAVT